MIEAAAGLVAVVAGGNQFGQQRAGAELCVLDSPFDYFARLAQTQRPTRKNALVQFESLRESGTRGLLGAFRIVYPQVRMRAITRWRSTAFAVLASLAVVTLYIPDRRESASEEIKEWTELGPRAASGDPAMIKRFGLEEYVKTGSYVYGFLPSVPWLSKSLGLAVWDQPTVMADETSVYCLCRVGEKSSGLMARARWYTTGEEAVHAGFLDGMVSVGPVGPPTLRLVTGDEIGLDGFRASAAALREDDDSVKVMFGLSEGTYLWANVTRNVTVVTPDRQVLHIGEYDLPLEDWVTAFNNMHREIAETDWTADGAWTDGARAELSVIESAARVGEGRDIDVTVTVKVPEVDQTDLRTIERDPPFPPYTPPRYIVAYVLQVRSGVGSVVSRPTPDLNPEEYENGPTSISLAGHVPVPTGESAPETCDVAVFIVDSDGGVSRKLVTVPVDP